MQLPEFSNTFIDKNEMDNEVRSSLIALFTPSPTPAMLLYMEDRKQCAMNVM